MSRPMRVLVACEFSGIVREAFRRLGHDAWSCDIVPALDGSPYHIQCDIRELLSEKFQRMGTYSQVPRQWDVLIGHPPCDRLLGAGSLHWPKWKASGEQDAAIEFFLWLWNAPVPKIAIENPVGIMTKRLFKPQYIDPWQFGHLESKKTGLWLKGLPELKPTKYVYTEMMKLPRHQRERVHYESPGVKNGLTRSQRRSIIFTGIADAMAAQWGGDAR